jgi:hypothetical protein
MPESANISALAESAPSVRFEPCTVYEYDEASPGCCAACGWLDDDHEVHAAAVVARFPAPRRVERRAS